MKKLKNGKDRETCSIFSNKVDKKTCSLLTIHERKQENERFCTLTRA